MSEKFYTLQDLANRIGAKVKGDPSCKIYGMSPIETAAEGQITFVLRPKFIRFLEETKASAVVIHPKEADKCHGNALLIEHPDVGYAKIAHLFDRSPKPDNGIHPSAIIGEGSQVSSTATIGPHVVIGKHVTIGDQAVISANSVISNDCLIGAKTFLAPNVTLYHDVQIGEQCIIHSGAVIGSDGFGMVNDQGKWLKIPQLGGVRIGNHVEVGANTTIDRGAMQNTTIGHGVKLDNQIQIAHNVEIGDHTVIAGCVAIAGSTRIGRYCLIGGASCIADHLEITDNVMLAGMSGVTRSITQPGIYGSVIPVEPKEKWQKNVAHYRKLGDLVERIKKLEKLHDAKTSGN